MYNALFAHRITAMALPILWIVITLLVITLHRQWWRSRAVRQTLWIVPTVSLLIVGGWVLATWYEVEMLAGILGVAAATLLVVSIALVVSLPFSGVVLVLERLVRWLGERGGKAAAGREGAPRSTAEVDMGRRRLVVGGAAAIPAATVLAGGVGVTASFADPRFHDVPLTFRTLPPALNGVRVLHLTDIHLGYFHDLRDLERIMLSAERARPDLILLSGDVADDLTLLPDALRIINGLGVPTIASLGNHEHYRGLKEVLRDFDRGPVPLLRDAGMTLKLRNTPLHILGLDDPAAERGAETVPFLRTALDHALDGAPSDTFTIAMSHRPRGLDATSLHNIPLTVAGHTHGGIQIGFAERSVLEPWYSEQYFWGHYTKGESQLYTSAGVGHWFPFRLGCPAEAPIYVLRQAQG